MASFCILGYGINCGATAADKNVMKQEIDSAISAVSSTVVNIVDQNSHSVSQNVTIKIKTHDFIWENSTIRQVSTINDTDKANIVSSLTSQTTIDSFVDAAASVAEKAYAKATGIADPNTIAKTSSVQEFVAKMKTSIKQNINDSTYLSCLHNTMQNVDIEVVTDSGGSATIRGVNIDQSITEMSKCLSNIVTKIVSGITFKQSLIDRMKADLDAISKTEGLLSEIMDDLLYGAIAIVILILVIFMIEHFTGKKSGKTKSRKKSKSKKSS